METIGGRLKYIREQLKMKHLQLGEILNASEKSIYSYESDKTAISSEMLAKLGQHYPNLNLNWLILGEGEMWLEHKGNTEMPTTIQEPYIKYNSNKTNKAAEEIESLRERLNKLESQMEGKDKEIALLREMLESKKQELESKNEIIELLKKQSK